MRKRPDLDNDIAEALRLLVVNPFAPQLETHKLKGKLSGSWACSAGYDLRIVFDFVKAEKSSVDDIFLLVPCLKSSVPNNGKITSCFLVDK
jgi:mRNA-degrading endonuclease YafQ of YafQ-DinJ toxin-antitoxin module